VEKVNAALALPRPWHDVDGRFQWFNYISLQLGDPADYRASAFQAVGTKLEVAGFIEICAAMQRPNEAESRGEG
jgi:hypothetical protein